MERHQRLRLAREEHFGTAKEAAASLGIPYQTYAAHEAGSRGIKEDDLRLYARRFRKPLAWLAFGIDEGHFFPESVVFGEFGGGDNPDLIHPPDIYAERRIKSDAKSGKVAVPDFNFDTMAARISGAGISVSIRNGWVVFFDNKTVYMPPFASMIGQICICILRDGQVFLKEIHPGKDDEHFDLESPNSPTIRDVVVERVCRVICLAPPYRGTGARVSTTTFEEGAPIEAADFDDEE